MKRMSEVFELPVNSRHVYVATDLLELLEDAKQEVFEAAAHAINNCDALADALDKAISLLSRPASTRLIHEQELLNVLNTYRGTK